MRDLNSPNRKGIFWNGSLPYSPKDHPMVLRVPRATLVKFFVFWFLWWYFLETIVLLLSYLMNLDVFAPLAEYDLPDVLAEAITIVFFSISWPLHIALLAILALLDFGYFGLNYFVQPRFLLLYLTGGVTLLFTLVLWKTDKIWI
jgi:hypothetical protein